MAGDWVEACPEATELFARASAILGYDLLSVCRSGPAERLNTTAVSQPAILVTSLAALEVLRGRDGAPVTNMRQTAGGAWRVTRLDGVTRDFHDEATAREYARRWGER
jgi:[acyl-carrier-protein] S-malonyltransferase